jgi:hypothetical protein
MTGKARNSQVAQDLQRIVDAAQTSVQTNPHQSEETITPDHLCNTQWVPRVNAPASHTPYQWQQKNHAIRATAGTNFEDAHHYPYSQTNQHTPCGNHHRI